MFFRFSIFVDIFFGAGNIIFLLWYVQLEKRQNEFILLKYIYQLFKNSKINVRPFDVQFLYKIAECMVRFSRRLGVSSYFFHIVANYNYSTLRFDSAICNPYVLGLTVRPIKIFNTFSFILR